MRCPAVYFGVRCVRALLHADNHEAYFPPVEGNYRRVTWSQPDAREWIDVTESWQPTPFADPAQPQAPG